MLLSDKAIDRASLDSSPVADLTNPVTHLTFPDTAGKQ
jgi:hypothetical protein